MPKESRQHYRYALGSVHECAAYLDALIAIQVIKRDDYADCEDQLARLSAMITRLMAHQTRREQAGK